MIIARPRTGNLQGKSEKCRVTIAVSAQRQMGSLKRKIQKLAWDKLHITRNDDNWLQLTYWEKMIHSGERREQRDREEKFL